MKGAKVIITGLFLVSIAAMAFFILKNRLPHQAVQHQAVLTNTQQPARKAFGDQHDLYFYPHPYFSKAHQFNEQKNYDSAICYYQQASAKLAREQQWRYYVWVNGYIGRLYLKINGKNYKDAFPFLQKAFETGNRRLAKNDPFVAMTLYYLGKYHYNNKNADTALREYNEALQILTGNYGEKSIYTSDIYESIGDVFLELYFNYTRAEEYYQKSIAIKEALHDRKIDSVLTSSYYSLVKFYMQNGDMDKAQTYCYKAIQYTPFIARHKQAWEELLEGALADIYKEQHLYQKAILTVKHAIRINNENKAGDKAYLAYYFNALGDLYSNNLLYDSAIYFYKQSLYFTQYPSIYDDQQLRASTADYSLGMVFLQQKHYPAALNFFHQCLNIRLEKYGKKNPETAVAFQAIANIYQELGVMDSALLYIQEGIVACAKIFKDTAAYAVPSASDLNASIYPYQMVTDKARMLRQLYNHTPSEVKALDASFAYYCLADTLITAYGAEYDRETAQLRFVKKSNSIYEEAIDCATALYLKTGNLQYHEFVFRFMDKRKSGLLITALEQENNIEQANISSGEQKAYRELQQERTFLQSRLEEENSKDDGDDNVVKALHQRVYENEAQIKALKATLSEKYPYYKSLQPAADTIHLKDLKLYASRSNALIVEYFWGDKAIYSLGLFKGKSHLIKIENKTALEAGFDTVSAFFNTGYVSASSHTDFNAYQNNSLMLYGSLFKPFLTYFELTDEDSKDKPALVVIPDGLVSYIPFEALVTAPVVSNEPDYRRLHYLLNYFTVSYQSSARLLLKKQPDQRTGNNCRVLGLSFSTDEPVKNTSGSLHALRSISNEALPGSAKELKSVSSYMDGSYYMGERATEAVFKKEAPNYDILHLAVHGQADSKNSYGSRLIFKKGTDSANDESLYAYEMYNIPIKAKLAVLSACESGVGKLQPGEGLFSMARGFFYAGCPAVVMSFWKVNDDLTAMVMDGFYQQLASGETIDRSLRKAKLAFIAKADRRSAHPAYWASFVAMGKMEPVVTKNNAKYTAVVLIAILMLVAISVYFLRNIFRRKIVAGIFEKQLPGSSG